MVHCNNLAFRSRFLSNLFHLLWGVGWYKFVCGFVDLVRKKQHMVNRSNATTDHRLQKKKQNILLANLFRVIPLFLRL